MEFHSAASVQTEQCYAFIATVAGDIAGVGLGGSGACEQSDEQSVAGCSE